MKYSVKIEYDEETGCWIAAFGDEVSIYVYATGDTPHEAHMAFLEMLQEHLDDLVYYYHKDQLGRPLIKELEELEKYYHGK